MRRGRKVGLWSGVAIAGVFAVSAYVACRDTSLRWNQQDAVFELHAAAVDPEWNR